MPACVSAQGGSPDEAALSAPQMTGETTMPYETKKQQRGRVLTEFLRRLREAPPGTRVYMPVGDVFKDADVHGLDEWRAAVVRDDDVVGGDEEKDGCG
jgi:hypothetical protein